jgi:GT2 family glycosyltransferase
MIDETIKSILKQETDIPYEVIVVGMDNWQLVKKFPEVKFIETHKPVGAATARNIGIKNSETEWLLFIDSDCIAQIDWIKTFSNNFEEGWKVIGGGVQSPENPFWVLVYNLSMLHGNLDSDDKRVAEFLPTLNLAVHRSVISKVGLMNEKLMRGQDIEWTVRMTMAGYKLLFNPQAKVEHYPIRKDFQTLRDFNLKSGYYMISVRYNYPEIFHMPKILKNPNIWNILSPLIASAATVNIFLTSKKVRQHFKTLPFIYLLKLSWCQGAGQGLKVIKDNV